ncbi:MAG: hypothetical protein HYT16_01710 [DPANN group archaeon]|nr:hypothetical protein [DPANN group archaeon]
MAVAASIPTLGAVIITAAVDSINPCAIGVLILLVSILTASHVRKKLLTYGFLYISAVFATYLAAGLGLVYFFSRIPLYLSEYLAIAVASIIVFAGLVEIKDYFWYGRGFTLSIPPEMSKKISDYTKKITLPGILFLGAFVAGVELPCTGAPYLAIIALLSQQFDLTAFLLLVLYNFIFVLPLIAILMLTYFGTKIHVIKKWKHRNRPLMRLASGVLLIFLGWLLILIANGTITFI